MDTLFSGKAKELTKIERLVWVLLFIKKKLVPSLVKLPEDVSERLMSLCLHLHGSCYTTVVILYAPKLNSDEVVIA